MFIDITLKGKKRKKRKKDVYMKDLRVESLIFDEER